MRTLFLALMVALLGADSAHGLELCVKADRRGPDPTAPKENSSIKLRLECRAGREVSLGTTEQLAAISTIQSDVDANTVAIATKTELPCASQVGTDVFFEGCNVHVRSGEGATWGKGTESAGTVNGLGNLIVGYDETSGGDKTGSHNLLVGPYHSYPSYGGFIAGYSNVASGAYSSVSGGDANVASGNRSWVSGGQGNLASGLKSSVSGGQGNDASGSYSSVSGGYGNDASGLNSSVSGGDFNLASGLKSSVSGGDSNVASGLNSSVSGGYGNTAGGWYSSVLGGQLNTATGDYSIAP